MLKDSLYLIADLKNTGQAISAAITLYPEHKIFKGHYPGQPVLPGACMLQILKDVLETALSAKLMMVHTTQLKFLAMVDPRQNTALRIETSYQFADDEMRVKASVFSDNVINFKFTGNFKYL